MVAHAPDSQSGLVQTLVSWKIKQYDNNYLGPLRLTIRVFPKWISLNSANSVNHDKIQKWYGYQSYHLLKDTLPLPVIKGVYLCYLWVGIYCQSPLGTDTNLQSFFNHYIKECNYCQMYNVSSNHTGLGFCHDSLNSLHLEKNSVVGFSTWRKIT